MIISIQASNSLSGVSATQRGLPEGALEGAQGALQGGAGGKGRRRRNRQCQRQRQLSWMQKRHPNILLLAYLIRGSSEQRLNIQPEICSGNHWVHQLRSQDEGERGGRALPGLCLDDDEGGSGSAPR